MPHSPRVVAMVARIYMCEKVNNLIDYFLVILIIVVIYLILINSLGKQHKMLKRRPVIK